MKKKLLLIPSIAFMLCGCTIDDLMFWKKKENEQGQKEEKENPGTDPDDPGTDPGDPVVPVEDDRLESLTIRESFIQVNIEQRSSAATVEIEYKEGYSWDDISDEYHWVIGDESIASVDEYGRVTGKKKGKTTLTFKIDNCVLKSTIPVYVISSPSDITKTWKKMGAFDELQEKDTIIIACPEKGKAATDNATGHKLHSTSVTFSEDKQVITNPGSAAQFYVYSDYKGRDGYTFEIPDREDGSFLGCSNTENVSFFDTPKSSQTVWSVCYDSTSGVWDMRPGGTVVDGWMMYNADIDQFTTYQSNQTQFMFVASLYRLVYTINL